MADDDNSELMPLPDFVLREFEDGSGSQLRRDKPLSKKRKEQQRDTSEVAAEEIGFFSMLFGAESPSTPSANISNEVSFDMYQAPPLMPNPCLSEIGTCIKSHDAIQTYAGGSGGLGGEMFQDVCMYGLGASVLMSQSIVPGLRGRGRFNQGGRVLYSRARR